MLILKKLPWVSLVLLLLTYSSLGWVISKADTSLSLWVFTIIAVLVLTAILTAPWTNITSYSLIFFRSNLRSFGFAITGAFLFFLMIAWFRVFLDTLVIIATAILVRIDFQAAGFRDGPIFLITSLFSMIGLAVGVLAEKLMETLML